MKKTLIWILIAGIIGLCAAVSFGATGGGSGGTGAGPLPAAALDSDASSYLSITGISNDFVRARINNGFKALKGAQWGNLVDGGVFGTNANLGGTFLRTFKGRYVTNVAYNGTAPVSLAYGTQYGTNTGWGYLHGLPDCKVCTLFVICDGFVDSNLGEWKGWLFCLQNANGLDGSLGLVMDTYINANVCYRPTAAQEDRTLNTWVYGLNSRCEHCFVMASDGAGNIYQNRDGMDGGYRAILNATGHAESHSYTSLNFGGALTSDNGTFTNGLGCQPQVTVKAFLLYNTVLNQSQLQTAIRALRWFDMRTKDMLIVGDSRHTDGYGSNNGDVPTFPTWFLFGSNQLVNVYKPIDFGKGGSTTQDHLGYYAGTFSYMMPVPGGPVTESIFYGNGGANDFILNTGASSGQWPNVYNNVRDLLSNAGSNGFTCWYDTCYPFTNYSDLGAGHTATQILNEESNRISFNLAIRTNQTLAVKVIDMARRFPVMARGSTLTTDGLHLTGYGCQIEGAFASAGGVLRNLAAPGLQLNAMTVTAAYTLTEDDWTIRADTTSAGFTVTLPAAPPRGMVVNVKKISSDGNTLTISGNGNNIDGSATKTTTTQYTTFRLQFNGTTWDLL